MQSFFIYVLFLNGGKKIQNCYSVGTKLVKFYDWSQNSMTFSKFFMFNNFSMTMTIFQVFQSLWEPCEYAYWPVIFSLGPGGGTCPKFGYPL